MPSKVTRHTETPGSTFSLPVPGAQGMANVVQQRQCTETADGDAHRPDIQVKFWMTRPARSCCFGALEGTCLDSSSSIHAQQQALFPQ